MIDLISVQDHPYNGSSFDTWTLITALAMSTKNIHFITNVADVPLRHPPLLAKSAATLDILAKGRVELGVGAVVFMWRAIWDWSEMYFSSMGSFIVGLILVGLVGFLQRDLVKNLFG